MCRLESRAIFTVPHKCVQHILLFRGKNMLNLFSSFFSLLEQSLKEKVVGIAAGLRHALAATGKYVIVFSFLEHMKSTFNVF